MSDENNDSQDVKATPAEASNPLTPNPIASRSREAIEKKFAGSPDTTEDPETSTDAPSAKGESDTDPDLKSESDSEQHSDIAVENPEKPTSVKKGKGHNETRVPLQALHESRDRFRTLNLEYREYKAVQDDKVSKLQDQLTKLQAKIDTSLSDDDESAPEDATNAKLRAEDEEKAKESIRKAQQETQKSIEKVSEELSKEGFKGFGLTVAKTGNKLQELVQSGDLTQAESLKPEVWKDVYKEYVYPEVREAFNLQETKETMENKKAAKRKASLVNDPGKAPEVPEEETEDNSTLDQFTQNQLKKKMAEHRAAFYKR